LVFLTNHHAGTSNTTVTTTHKKHTQQSMQTANICETKPNDTKAWFRSSLLHLAGRQIGPVLQLSARGVHTLCPLPDKIFSILFSLSPPFRLSTPEPCTTNAGLKYYVSAMITTKKYNNENTQRTQTSADTKLATESDSGFESGFLD